MATTRMYATPDFTVFTWGGTSVLTYVGSATIKGEDVKRVENEALMDTWQNKKTLKKGLTIDVEIASDTACGIDFKTAWKNGTDITLVLTDSKGSSTGTFNVTSYEKSYNETIRERVTCELVGALS